jgi:hypothetical protein
MKITHAKLAQLGLPNSRGNRLVTICAELAGPKEFMTITVTVKNSGSDREVCDCGIARAKDFARRFAELPLQHFPRPV